VVDSSNTKDTSEQNINDVVAMLKRFQGSRDEQIFYCMILDVFDEYLLPGDGAACHGNPRRKVDRAPSASAQLPSNGAALGARESS